MRNSCLRWHGVRASNALLLLLLLHVLLVGDLMLLLGGNVGGVHACIAPGHSGLWRWDLRVTDFFR